ncbi:hypothetical protein HQ47_01470 [Porphyromonas macacae]|uniref:Uncharacterized protein n=1 Tax=Porphyromonas macacae TaxID=28115 RepID=A0A0A2E9R9_9PORP|nr:hypothetical protein [Porphyromonas macacae]KGN75636.1 hypothetical protein HQ47_01470 [Porphyromonas macacae]SUB89871.1 Uncharacterised protein [Porphyromonas macacae]
MKEKEESLFPFSIKAGEYHTMFKIGLKWILPFSFSIMISSMMGVYRYIAFFTITASVWGLALKHLSKRMVEMIFTDGSIIIDNNKIPLGAIKSFSSCLPLKKYFILTLRTLDEKEYIYYIPVKYRSTIEKYLSDRICFIRQKKDILLSATPTIFIVSSVLVSLLCFGLMYSFNH